MNGFVATALKPGAIQVGILTDSLLSYARFDAVRHMKPGRESTKVCADVWFLLKQYNNKLQVKQFSYTGLKAFALARDGETDRSTVFAQMEQEYPDVATRPKIWFSVIGINDFKTVEEHDVFNEPERLLEQFVSFFQRIRDFSPQSRVWWLGIGNVFTRNYFYRRMEKFRDFLLNKADLPSWLKYEDIGRDCKDENVKDETGHWEDGYIKVTAGRLVEKLKKVVDVELKKPALSRANGESEVTPKDLKVTVGASSSKNRGSSELFRPRGPVVTRNLDILSFEAELEKNGGGDGPETNSTNIHRIHGFFFPFCIFYCILLFSPSSVEEIYNLLENTVFDNEEAS